MWIIKKYITTFLTVFFFVLFMFLVMMYNFYQDTKDTVERQLPELIRLVAEDNCLDNTIPYDGKTIYQSYINKLESVENNNNFVRFDPDAVNVTYGGVQAFSRATAPQKGATLEITLTGYFDLKFPIGTLRTNLPIVFKEPVIGIRYYRDRD